MDDPTPEVLPLIAMVCGVLGIVVSAHWIGYQMGYQQGTEGMTQRLDECGQAWWHTMNALKFVLENWTP